MKYKVTYWNIGNTHITGRRKFKKLRPAKLFATGKFIRGHPVKIDRYKK